MTCFIFQTYDTSVSFEPVTPPDQINKGDGLILTVEAFITKPNTPIEIIIFQPLGFNVLALRTCKKGELNVLFRTCSTLAT